MNSSKKMMKRTRLKKRSADERSDDERVIAYHDGSCSLNVCKGETACKNYPNNKYACLCTHDSQPPTAGGTCPRRIVNEQPGRIPNVQPPSIKIYLPGIHPNTTLPLVETSLSTTENYSLAGAGMATNSIIFGSLSVLSVILTLLSYYALHQRGKQQSEVAGPISLKHSLLNAERCFSNPGYAACPGTGIVPLRKERLHFLDKLGEGCFGKVYKGELVTENSDTSKIVAIKVLKGTANKEAEDDFYREVEIMSAFKHPNILPLLGVVLKGEGDVSPMMVFEYMEYGDLAELLRNQKDIPEEGKIVPSIGRDDLLYIAKQIAYGMEYLAAQRFVHRDLACRNCLLAKGLTVKIADFGMSRDVYTNEYYKIASDCPRLPVRWLSPESVLHGRFTLESDVWSYGVVLWEIYSLGKMPYYGHSNYQVIQLISDGIMLNPPVDCPPQIRELMENCWKLEPKHRITFTKVREILEEYSQSVEENTTECSNDALSNNTLALNKIQSTRFIYENESKARFIYENESKARFIYENESNNNCTNKQVAESKMKSLPRPPPITQLSTEDLDTQGYLIPNNVKEPAH